MTREEAIARIIDHKYVHKMDEPRAVYISEALDMAIKSLDMWDKVIRELHELIQGDNGVELVQVGEKRALGIIERYKKEIEE